MPTELTSVETVRTEGSWLFTATDAHGVDEEVLLVPCEDGVEAWVNRCTHEAQRFDTGGGAPIREGQLVCPKHGSLFDACDGTCDNGEAAGTQLSEVEIAVEDGAVFLTDDDYTFVDAGGSGGNDPGSTSNISF